jgi:hypothetical protein
MLEHKTWKKIQDYKRINRTSYTNTRQYEFIESVLSFYEEKRFLTPKQQESLIKTIDSLFVFIRDHTPQKYSKFDYQQKKYKHYDFNDEIKELIESLIDKNGVYFLQDEDEKIIYIGKSSNLGKRMIESFVNKKAFAFSYLITKSHIDCCIKELYYISFHKPIFNNDPVIIDDVIDYEPDYYDNVQGPFYLDKKEDLENGITINDTVNLKECIS